MYGLCEGLIRFLLRRGVRKFSLKTDCFLFSEDFQTSVVSCAFANSRVLFERIRIKKGVILSSSFTDNYIILMHEERTFFHYHSIQVSPLPR